MYLGEVFGSRRISIRTRDKRGEAMKWITWRLPRLATRCIAGAQYLRVDAGRAHTPAAEAGKRDAELPAHSTKRSTANSSCWAPTHW